MTNITTLRPANTLSSKASSGSVLTRITLTAANFKYTRVV